MITQDRPKRFMFDLYSLSLSPSALLSSPGGVSSVNSQTSVQEAKEGRIYITTDSFYRVLFIIVFFLQIPIATATFIQNLLNAMQTDIKRSHLNCFLSLRLHCIIIVPDDVGDATPYPITSCLMGIMMKRAAIHTLNY